MSKKIEGKMYEVIDLTYPICEGMTTFNAPWHPHVEITKMGRLGFEGRSTTKISFGSHTGTHMDAPLHFVKDGESIDLLETERMIGPVTIISLNLKENEIVTKSHLQEIKFSERVIFNFGWGKNWGSKKFYNGYPFFSKDAAEYLIKQGVKMVCMDTPSPDDSRISLQYSELGSDKDSPIHKIFLSNGIILIEYLANLSKIKANKDWQIAALPLKIQGSDGSPARVILFRTK